MSAVLEMLIPAAALSGAAAVCLALLPNAPGKLRLGLALGGLAAWLVPWPMIDLHLALPYMHVLTSERFAASAAVPDALPAARSAAGLTYIALALLVGAAWFAADWLRLRAVLRQWSRRSRPGDDLRALLPARLRSTRMRIRVVQGTRVAAAAGLIRPTIWIGDGFADADLPLVLVHECWHVRGRDPLWLALLAVVRRVYWWNPLVARLAGEVEISIEAACDRRCIRLLGRESYVPRLAALMLDARGPSSPPLAAAVHGRNVRRLKLLEAEPRLSLRDCVLVALATSCGALAAGYAVAEPRVDVPAGESRAILRGTSARDALAAVLRGVRGGDLELVQTYFGAYTPQEVKFERSDWSEGVELVEVVHEDAREIEFVVRDAGGKRRLGRLSVADSAAIQVTAAEFRDLPSREP